MIQRLTIIALCILVMVGSLAVAGWAVISGQVFKQGVEAIFLIIVCLTLAAAFSFVPIQAWMSGSLQQMLGMKTAPAGSEHAGHTEEEVFVDTTLPDPGHAPPIRLFFIVWIWLLVLTGVEVVLGYIHIFSNHVMLAILMLLSLGKAGMIVAYFMHMKYERRSFVLSLVPATLVVMTLLCAFFADSFRILELGIR